MKKQYPIYFLVVLSGFLGACQPNYHNIEDYYFPIKDLKSEMTYQYRSAKGDSLVPYSWTYKTLETDSATLLESIRYDNFGTAEQRVLEEVVSNGTIIADYILYMPDSLGKMQTLHPHWTAATVFPFEVKDSTQGGGKYTFALKWQSPTDTLETVSVLRNRYFNGFKNYTTPSGVSYPDCVEFVTKSEQRLDHPTKGGISAESITIDRFAKGVGLVYTQTKFDGNEIAYYLHQRIPKK